MDLGHVTRHWYEYAVAGGIGAGVWSWASYAAQQFPAPQNKYGQWLLKIIQKALANQNKVDELAATKFETK